MSENLQRRAEDRGLAVVPVVHEGSRSVIKQPRYTITSSKMREALFYRWRLALLVGLIMAGMGGGLAWITYKPKYTATAQMRMSSSEQRLLPGAFPEEGARSGREEEFQKTQAYMAKSRNVLSTVLLKDQIRGLETIRKQENASLWLERQLQTGFIPGTDIFRISLSGDHPQEVADIVNMVMNVYLDQFVNVGKKVQADRFENIEKVMASKEDTIRTHRGSLRQLAEIHKTSDTQALTLKQRMALEEYGSMKRELSTLEADQRRLAATLSVQRTELKNMEKDPKVGSGEKIPAEVLEEYLDNHIRVQKEQHEVARLEAQIEQYSKLVTGASLRLSQMEAELKTARDLVKKVKLELQPEIELKLWNSMHRQRVNELNVTEAKLKVVMEQQAAVAIQVDALGKEAAKIGIGSFEIEIWRSQIEEAEAVLRKLRAEKERLEIEKFNNKEIVTARLEAEVPTENQASLVKTGSLYSLAGLLLGFFGVSYIEARVHRIHVSNEIHRDLGIPALGVLPLLAQKQQRTYGRTEPASESLPGVMFTEAVNGLCARLLCDDRLSKNAAIMVTSANEHEGKTVLATQLATGLARSGRKTLLIDGDFRNPRCHHQLGLPLGPGLSEVLQGEAELADALQTIPDSEARILTGGLNHLQVTKSLHNGEFLALLTKLRKEFDCIIFDSAPTLVVADGLLIGKLVNGVILVIRPKVSKAPDVFAAYEQLTSLKIRILGTVVNANPAQPSSSYYARS